MVISTLRRIVFFGSVCIFLGSAGGGSGNQEKRQKPVLTEEVPKITVERVAADTTGQKEDSGTGVIDTYVWDDPGLSRVQRVVAFQSIYIQGERWIVNSTIPVQELSRPLPEPYREE